MPSKIPVAVLGASGVVGQHFVALLENHPWFELSACFASRKRKFSEVNWYASLPKPKYADSLEIQKLNIDDIVSSSKAVFSALPAKVAIDVEKELANRGVWVFSNASAYRMQPNVPILIPEINAKHLELVSKTKKASIITNSNCSTSGLTLSLAPFLKFGIKKCYVSTYQALSGAGYPGVSAMDITGNLLPHINGEEEKIVKESKKILGIFESDKIISHSMDITASAFRVNVPYGHTEAVFIELEHSIDRQTAIEALSEFTGFDPDVTKLPSTPKQILKVFNDPWRPQPKYDYFQGNGMTVSIGSVKTDKNTLSFKLLVNNLIRGAAGGSVQNAELAYIKGYIK